MKLSNQTGSLLIDMLHLKLQFPLKRHKLHHNKQIHRCVTYVLYFNDT